MQYRELGRTGLKLPALSYGASSLGQEFRQIDMNEALRSVRAALDNGLTFIDTSPFYGRGMSEVLLKFALREAQRLAATDPPLGLGPEGLHVAERPWSRENDLLVLFTDGVSDARDSHGTALGERRVLDVLRARRREVPSRIVDGVFALVDGHMGRMSAHDDQCVIVLRSA